MVGSGCELCLFMYILQISEMLIDDYGARGLYFGCKKIGN